MTPAPKRRRFRFSLRALLLEVMWIGMAFGAWEFLTHADPPTPLWLPVIAFYTSCGAAIGGLVGRPGWGAIIAVVGSSILVAISWPPDI